MAGRLIWFFGPSAAGKDTLIHAIDEQRDHPMRSHLDIGDIVAICEESLNTHDPRDGLADAIVGKLKPGIPLLAKGQTTDMSVRHVPQGFKARPRDCWQEVVFVWAQPATLAERCAARAQRYLEAGDLKKAAEWATYGEPGCVWELGEQVRWVSALELPTCWVESTEDGKARIGVEPL